MQNNLRDVVSPSIPRYRGTAVVRRMCPDSNSLVGMMTTQQGSWAKDNVPRETMLDQWQWIQDGSSDGYYYNAATVRLRLVKQDNRRMYHHSNVASNPS